jgi:uncharacterized protein YyaL (SSP411 family)
MSTSTPNAHTNRLAKETSPYLLQHQHNPVDWDPWGPEAFERARREDKPIFLSVGYSTCYWCHVMERQSFENEAVAVVMNEKFVNIKVDREERPDVDQLYMTAVQVLTRHGGWPMSVWLTPDLRPFYGGTYYPPTDMHGRPGFVTLLHALEDAYRNRRSDVEKTADQLVNILRQMARPAAPDAEVRIDDAFIEDQVGRAVSDYDPKSGGFGGAPKFPRETLLELLLVYLREGANSEFPSEVRRRVMHTLDALAAGGIRDQLGGGFHRYSTDARWLVPHFEIMLYDNALLAWCYAEAHRQTGEPRYASVARGVCDFVLREMTSPDTGAFYTALDAEVDGQEGLNYLWTAEEIKSILGPADAETFNQAYGVDRGPNFADPHHGTGQPDKNILFLPTPRETETLDAQLAPMCAKLKAVRDRRKQPLLDTKILTSWNALMIRALAFAGDVLHEPRYAQAATRAADFLLTHHRTPTGGLYRTSREGRAKYDAFLDDYAYLAEALLTLDRPKQAQEIASIMVDRFDGETGGFYFTDRGATDLLVRQQVAGDSPLPSGNAVAATVLLKLGDVERSRAVIAAFAQQLENNGEGMSAMVQAALLYLRKTCEAFTVSGGNDNAKSDVERPLSPQQTAENVVRVSAEWTSRTELAIRLSILRGFHVNAHDVDGASLVATRVSVESADASDVIYPPGEQQTFSFADAPARVYSGDVTIRIAFAHPVKSELRISLTYQACDESACLPPVTRRLTVPIS